MRVTPIKTHKITPNDSTIYKFLDQYLPQDLPEQSVVAITSKIVSICEGRVVEIEETKGTNETNGSKGESLKDRLIEQEAEFYLPRESNPYNVSLTIAKGMLAASAGIDESNGNGYYILWPEDPQKSANAIRAHIAKRLALSEVGVIITDSRTAPLRWGVTGVALAHSGFQALNSLIGKPDLFGRPFQYEVVNVMDSLAAAAAYVMGEGREQTPIAMITDIPHILFQDRDPSEEELNSLRISKEEDIYAPLLKSAPWKVGEKK